MAINEFEGTTHLQVRTIYYKYEMRKWLGKTVMRAFGRKTTLSPFHVKHRYTVRHAKNIVIDEGLAVVSRSQPSWFYTAFERDSADPLTNYSLRFIEENVSKTAPILITGCGTGITTFHLADCGFKSIEGRDLLDKCIRIATRLKNEFSYDEVKFLVDDCFNPTLDACYDLITAMHWVFSAWGGNYGNHIITNPKDPTVRERLLTDLLGRYAKHLNKNGLMIIELTDAVADYREAHDSPGILSLGLSLEDIYPIRHTPEQVSKCAKSVDLEIVNKQLSVSYGHQPRTTYFLKKN